MKFFRKGWQWASEQMIKFWWRSGSRIWMCFGGGMHCRNASSFQYSFSVSGKVVSKHVATLLSEIFGTFRLTMRNGPLLRHRVYVGWSDVAVICGHNTISMLWDKKAYCVKLSGEDLSRFLKIKLDQMV